MGKRTLSEDIALVKDNLNNRAIVLVGLMGAGKTSVGRRLAEKLDLPFVDADGEIERAAGKSIPEIFADHGEASFREGEKRVIARLLENGAQVLATGGGAYMNEETRALISNHGLALWLRADLELLLKRVAKRDNRPLLKQGDPREVMQALIDKRYPIYGLADIIVDSQDAQHSQTVNDVIRALASWPRIIMDLQNEETGLQMPDDKIQVPVVLGSRSYTIDIGHGLLAQSGTIVGQHLQRPFAAIVTDANVAPLHLKTLESALLAHGIKSHAITLPAGEGTKSYAQLAHLCDHLLGAGVERRDVVITLGGGVIGDLGGFAASIIRRGVNFIQMPTTLLSQVDSSVGGKTGINSGHGKNLVGTFHQPIHVIIDLSLLKTLPAREQAAGYAEVAKYGLLGDSAFFDWLESNGRCVMSCEADALLHAVETSCAMKARIVAADETETTGQRALLNLGHTFGHAYEAATGYSSRLLHGESVAIGMVQAFRFSERLGHCAKGVAERVERHLASVGLPTRVGHIKAMLPPPERLLELMRQDKKAVGGKLTFILVRGVGEAFVAKDVPDHQVLDFLEEDAQRP